MLSNNFAHSNNSLQTLQQKLKNAAAAIITHPIVIEHVKDSFYTIGHNPYGSPTLINLEIIDKYFAEENLKKITSIIKSIVLVLHKFEKLLDSRKNMHDILELAIQTPQFSSNRHCFHFCNHKTHLDVLITLKSNIENEERLALEIQNGVKIFYRN